MSESVGVQCCIAGGGPAGMMLGLLLARAGVTVLVLEKHADFLRDFRGDTIHPSTLEIMGELGLLEDFLQRPHDEIQELAAHIGGVRVPLADFTHLPTRCGFIAMMPQWDFLDFLAVEARRYPHFALRMQAEVIRVDEEAGTVVGLCATTPSGPLNVRADLVIGADGRGSVVRGSAHLAVLELGAPMDVLWFHLPRGAADPADTAGYIGPGRMFVLINRGAYWQCGFVIAKGNVDALRARGLEAFRAEIAELAPFLRAASAALPDWDAVKLLTVRVDRLAQWSRPGLLCIGDAAHAMSPIGGVGINLAIQDAVAAANILAVPLREGRVTADALRSVQARRALPTRLTQWAQVTAQQRVIARVLSGTGIGRGGPLPLPLRLLQRFPRLRRIPARLVGLGVRPEHVQSADVARLMRRRDDPAVGRPPP